MDKNKPRFFILVGDEETWKVAIKNNLWGFGEKTKGLWNKSEKGDLLAFYVTKPIGRVIGFGRINEKKIDESLVWPDELRFKKSLWKYRFQLDISHVIKKWRDGAKVPDGIMLNTGRKVVMEDVFRTIVKNADSIWGTKLSEQYFHN